MIHVISHYKLHTKFIVIKLITMVVISFTAIIIHIVHNLISIFALDTHYFNII